MKLLSDKELEGSSTVAHASMNRGRNLQGVNSYTKDLGLNPIEVLKDKEASWLDLCCGEGKALVQASQLLPNTKIVGLDLVPMFQNTSDLANISLQAVNVLKYQPDTQFDLITCVHGLHYIGDKIALLCQIAKWLKKDGIFQANFEAKFVSINNNKPGWRPQSLGFKYNSKRRILSGRGPMPTLATDLKYLGSDDQNQNNYLGLKVVQSYYQKV